MTKNCRLRQETKNIPCDKVTKNASLTPLLGQNKAELIQNEEHETPVRDMQLQDGRGSEGLHQAACHPQKEAPRLGRREETRGVHAGVHPRVLPKPNARCATTTYAKE